MPSRLGRADATIVWPRRARSPMVRAPRRMGLPCHARVGRNPPGPDRRVGLHLPRVLRAAALDRPKGRAGRRRLRLLQHAVPPGPGHGGRPAGGGVRQGQGELSRRDLPRLQGQPARAARRPRAAVPAGARSRPCGRPAGDRARGLRGGRHHRDLRPRGERGRPRGDHRLVRQGPDAADPRGRPDVRPDEAEGDRPRRGDRAFRRRAGAGARRAGARRRHLRQRPGRAGHRGQDGGAAVAGVRRPRRPAGQRRHDQAAQAPGEPARARRAGAGIAEAGHLVRYRAVAHSSGAPVRRRARLCGPLGVRPQAWLPLARPAPRAARRQHAHDARAGRAGAGPRRRLRHRERLRGARELARPGARRRHPRARLHDDLGEPRRRRAGRHLARRRGGRGRLPAARASRRLRHARRQPAAARRGAGAPAAGARRPGRAQGRAQSQVRPERARPLRARGRALRRHHAAVLRDRRRAPRPWRSTSWRRCTSTTP